MSTFDIRMKLLTDETRKKVLEALARPDGVIVLGKVAPLTVLHAGARECFGCGAPLKAYIHHCEYCRRTT